MKKIILLFIACALFGISNAQESKVDTKKNDASASKDKEQITVDKTEHDFGTISESGDDVTCTFTFKNNGNTPIVITKITTSCGCTTYDHSKEPIAPGKEGFAKITYSPKGNEGKFTKSVVVYTNGNPRNIRLKIKGVVK